MRVLHIDTGAEMRGGQHQVLLLLNTLREAGHESILLARSRSPLFEAACEAGFRVHPAALRAVWKHSGNAHIVHAHDARAHTMAALASRRIFVVSRRVAFALKRSLASRWKYGKAARYLAVSEVVAKELESAGIRREKIDIVYDGVAPVSSVSPWNPEYPALALASNDPQKGRDLIEQAAKNSGVEVQFSSSLLEDLKRASMFLYITRSEGLGSAALLAMNFGVPVIASRVGGLTEVLEDGVSGILVSNDVAEIMRAMRKVLGSRGVAQGLIDEGRKRIAEAFTAEHLLRSTLASYGRAFGG